MGATPGANGNSNDDQERYWGARLGTFAGRFAGEWLWRILVWVLSLAALLGSGCGHEPTRGAAPPERESQKEQQVHSPISDQAVRDAALEGKINTLRRAIEQGLNVNAVDSDGRTALMLAAFNGHTEGVKLMLEHNARVDDRDATRRTALIYAASGPNHETIRVLLEAGADVDAVDNVEGWSALMFAAAEGHLEVVRALLSRHADVSLSDVDGDTARDFAAKNGHQAIAALLGE